MRLGTKTPLITRSDGMTFHLYLFSGPDTWYGKSGGVIAGRAAATYFYASDPLGIEHSAVTVIFRTTGLNRRGVEEAMRDATDQMVAMLSAGKSLTSALYYDGGDLSVFDPAARP